jgi:RNA polymerase sigma-70 factor (ECF subfamily)
LLCYNKRIATRIFFTDQPRRKAKNWREPDPLSASDEGKIDPAEAAELHDQYSEELRRFLIGLLRDGQLADDVAQTTFTKLVEHGHTTREESRRGWLYRVAYREAMLVRRRQAVDDAARRRVAWSREAVGEPAESLLLQAETIQEVRRAIEELPAEQRRVVRMRIYEDKTFSVIAEELGIPLGTALGRMRAALKKLRARLESER